MLSMKASMSRSCAVESVVFGMMFTVVEALGAIARSGNVRKVAGALGLKLHFESVA